MASITISIKDGEVQISAYGIEALSDPMGNIQLATDCAAELYALSVGEQYAASFEEDDEDEIDLDEYRTASQDYLESKEDDVYIEIPTWEYSSHETTVTILFADAPTEEFFDLIEVYKKYGFTFKKDTEMRFYLGVPKIFNALDSGKALAKDLYEAGYNVRAVGYSAINGKKELNFLGE